MIMNCEAETRCNNSAWPNLIYCSVLCLDGWGKRGKKIIYCSQCSGGDSNRPASRTQVTTTTTTATTKATITKTTTTTIAITIITTTTTTATPSTYCRSKMASYVLCNSRGRGFITRKRLVFVSPLRQNCETRQGGSTVCLLYRCAVRQLAVTDLGSAL